MFNVLIILSINKTLSISGLGMSILHSQLDYKLLKDKRHSSYTSYIALSKKVAIVIWSTAGHCIFKTAVWN